MKKLAFTLVALFMLVPQIAFCTEERADTLCTFNLQKEHGHYYFDADINNVKATFMLESAIPALLIDSAFYVQHKQELRLENLEEDSSRIRFLNKLYRIVWSGTNDVKIGDVIYSGKVFVLSNYKDCILLPIQNLRSQRSDKAQSSSQLLRLDLNALRLQVLSETAKTPDTSFNMRINKETGMPVVESQLSIRNGNDTATMQGDFIVDFGNASLLFLLKQHPAVLSMIKDNGLELQEAKTPQGVVVGEGLYAEHCTLLGITFDGASIGVTDKMKSLKEAGLIGLKFLVKPTLFDFKNMKMYIEQ